MDKLSRRPTRSGWVETQGGVEHLWAKHRVERPARRVLATERIAGSPDAVFIFDDYGLGRDAPSGDMESYIGIGEGSLIPLAQPAPDGADEDLSVIDHHPDHGSVTAIAAPGLDVNLSGFVDQLEFIRAEAHDYLIQVVCSCICPVRFVVRNVDSGEGRFPTSTTKFID
jgi:hypothetical protein